MAIDLQTAKQGNEAQTTAQNGNKTQINSESVVKAISELYSETGEPTGTHFTINEICEQLGIDNPTQADARAFVRACNGIHSDPASYLANTDYYGIRRVKHDSDAEGYFGWAFALLQASQIGDTFTNSGFEGRTSHEVGNRLNSERWGNYLPYEKLSDGQKAKLDEAGFEAGN
jgi:hypothetical protein